MAGGEDSPFGGYTFADKGIERDRKRSKEIVDIR